MFQFDCGLGWARNTVAAHSVCSPPPCGEGLGVGVVVISLSMSSSASPDLKLVTRRTCHRVLTATPTPNPSPQGGGEHTACVATVLRRNHRQTRRVDHVAASPI